MTRPSLSHKIKCLHLLLKFISKAFYCLWIAEVIQNISLTGYFKSQKICHALKCSFLESVLTIHWIIQTNTMLFQWPIASITYRTLWKRLWSYSYNPVFQDWRMHYHKHIPTTVLNFILKTNPHYSLLAFLN